MGGKNNMKHGKKYTDSVKLIVAGGMIMLATASALVAITVATSI